MRRQAQGHPLRATYASGGTWLANEDDFVRVLKPSTVSLSPYALRLTVGALGGIAEAHDLIGERAAQAWCVDLDRSNPGASGSPSLSSVARAVPTEALARVSALKAIEQRLEFELFFT